ncbi:MAG: acetyl-CoA carboxylase carboxyltransferase subunit beta [Candidatus Helarchaeota archaeon]|nr:acetyl-CoA carboxylase carboxyltransferase subunit beta [Candidatus Helarchaeota archaeon]
MSWFKRSISGLLTREKKDLPKGLWVKCENCGVILYVKELRRNFNVCIKCNFHFKMGCGGYINMLVDEGSFLETDANMKSKDFLDFKGKEKYSEKLISTMRKVNLNEAIRTGFGVISGYKVVIGVMDFGFIGGSMGSVVGEKVKRSVERAMNEHLPLIIVSASGGARMMEGLTSLMQMAKTSAKIAEFSRSGGLYISILTNPTTAGVMASYAMLGDIIIAEPGALIGFAGPRVIKQTIGEDLPEGFQRSEFVLEHGFIDMIVNRREMKEKLTKILDFFIGDHNKMKR